MLANWRRRSAVTEALEELVLCYHGTAGGIIIGDDNYKLSDPALAKAFAKIKTRIDCIRFEGCWVGQEADEMAAFGRLFGSSTVSGFTWVSWTTMINVTIPKGSTLGDVKKLMAPFEKWIVPNTVNLSLLAAKGKQGGSQTIGLLWYQSDLEEHPPYLKDNYKRMGAVTYKDRSEVVARTVAAKDAKPNQAPRPPFEYVTVKF